MQPIAFPLMYSATAFAMEIPSNVDVPLPISSRMTRLFLVAFLSISATSFISTMNVDCPEVRSSDAPTRVNILSTTPIFAYSAGTKQPICAISTIIAVCRMNVDLPDMFGPVIIMSRLEFVSR